ncbi:hypothetical protein HY640_02120 [Candidatus Woesearchaeota archaeon]|nr:hypothetical protein [Candidatus Woesearchaeota archaeon]
MSQDKDIVTALHQLYTLGAPAVSYSIAEAMLRVSGQAYAAPEQLRTGSEPKSEPFQKGVEALLTRA